MLISYSIVFSIAIGFGLLICFLFWGLIVKVRTGLWLLVTATLLNAALGFSPRLYLGFNFYFSDLVFLSIGGAAVARFIFHLHEIPRYAAWALYGGMLLLSFARGVPGYGVSAGNELREFYYFWATAAYFASFPYDRRDLHHFMGAWVFMVFIICAVVAFRWTVDITGIDVGLDPRLWAPLSGSSLRVIGAGHALAITSGMVMLTYLLRTRIWSSTWCAFMLGLSASFVLALQHRSVWVCTLAALVLTLFLEQKDRARAALQLAIAGALVGVVLVPLAVLGKLDRLERDLSSSVQEATSARSTLTWRLQSAEVLAKDLLSSGPTAIAVGKPMGAGYNRMIEDTQQEITVAPHNYYVQIMMRVGVLGLSMFIVAYVVALRRLLAIHQAGDSAIDPRPWIVILAIQLIYFIPYSGDPPQAMLLGVALSVGAAARGAARVRMPAGAQGLPA